MNYPVDMGIQNLSERDFAALLMDVDTAVLLIDREANTIVYANNRASVLTGYGEREIVGRPCRNFICFSEAEQCPFCDLGRDILDEPSFIRRRDGVYHPVIRSIKPISLSDRQYLLNTFVTAQNSNRLQLQMDLQKLLLNPGPLEEKIYQICRTISQIKGIEIAEVWLNVRETQICNTPYEDYPFPLTLCSYAGTGRGLGAEQVNSFFSGAVSFIDTKTFRPDSVVTSFSLFSHEGNNLGLMLLYSSDPLTDENRHFIGKIAGAAVQVVENSLSEARLKEALELTEKANRLMEGREARIRDIKKEINELTSRLGWGNVYGSYDEENFSNDMDLSDLVELRRNALSLAEDAVIERKKAEEAQRELALIKHAVNSSGDGIVITLSNGDIHYANHTFDDMFGYSQAQLITGRQIDIFPDGKLYGKILEMIWRGRDWRGTADVRRADGTIFPVMLRISSIRNDKDALLGSIWHYIDISRQTEDNKRIEDDLKEKKELLRKAMILQNNYIQRSIPLFDRFNIEALFQPCEKLGGDFFKIHKGIRDEKLVIILGDCTGHGIRASMDASLLTSLTDQYLDLLYEENRTDLFLEKVALKFSETADEDQFPTLFVMIVDLIEELVYYSSANSTNPLLLRDGSVTEFPRAAGLHLGYEELPRFERKIFSLEEGDRVLFYSDALNETVRDGVLRFETEKLAILFGRGEGSAVNHFQSLVSYLSEGEFNSDDDMTLILLEYRAPRTFGFSFSSLDELKQRLKETEKLLSLYDYTEREIVPINISLDEMCLNAFHHGNKKDPALSVIVEGKLDCSGFFARISDQGSGFDYRSVPDPASVLEMLMDDDESEDFTHGRGIWICRNYMDRVEYSEKGNSVEIEVSKKKRQVLVSDEKNIDRIRKTP